MENLHAQIIDYLLTQSWQIGVLAVVIAAVSLAVKNKSAHVRYLLWLIVLAKCLVPPLYTITLAVLPQQQIPEPVVNAAVEIPAVAVMVEAVPTEPVTLPSRTVLAPPVEPSIAERLAEVTFRQWLAFVWIVGVGVFVLAAVIKALRVNQWLRRERRALPAKLQSEIEKLFAELGVKIVPKVWLVEGIGQPFVWGLLRGGIYLPGNFVGVTGDESRRGVLGHELSHILRFDAAVNLLQIIAQGIFWFHPFVWWANKKIRAEREKCCDEMAIARLGAKAKDYSSAIVNTLIAEHEATLPIPSLAVAGPVKNIEDRIKTIMNPGKKFYKRPSLIAAITVLLLASLAVPTTLALTRRKVDKADVGVEGEYDNSLYQKQGSIRYALEFIGTPEELIDTTFISKHGQLANPRQLEFANKLFSIRKSKDVDMFISLLSDGSKKQLKDDDNNRRVLHHRIKKIKEGTFLAGQYDFKFFATFREFTDEDWNTLKKHVSFPETPTHIIVYWHFDKPAYSLCGSSYYLIEDNGSYKFVAQTLLSGPVIPVKEEQPTVPKEYGIVAFKQTDNAYTQPAVWKYKWNIELSSDVSENNVFQILRTTKVVSGQAELHPEIAAQKIIDESMIEKYKYDILKCRFYVGNSEPRYNYRKYGRQLSGWAYGFSIASWSRSTSMLFPGKDVTNVKPNKQGNFVGSDLELLSFETSEENIRYEHKVILRKSDSPEAKSAALSRLEQMTRRQISNKKLQYLSRILATYANGHNSKYPDRLEQIKPYDTDEWLDWLLENIEYLGKGKTLTETSNTVLAYDKTLLGKAGSTNVLFNDGPVQYCNPDWLKKLGIAGEPAWGEAVEGVQMRVRPERQTWYEGQTPRFLVDMRNNGTVELELGLTQEHWEVELDGLWYRVGSVYSGVFSTLIFGPGEVHKDIEFYPGEWSEWNINGKALEFTPGWHTVRLAFGPSTRDRAHWRRLRVVSNTVVIEVLPKEVGSDSSIRGAEREAAARRTRAMGHRRRISFIGLDLTDAPRTTNQADLPDLFEERPVGSGSYALRDEVVAARHPEFWEEGVVYYVAEKKQFYIIEEPGHPGSGSKTFYGPFAGEPWKRFGMAEPRPVKKQYRFAIYLVVDPIDVGHPEDVTLEQLRLGSVPVLTEEDIVEYDWNEHFLKLTPEAWKRVPSPRSVWGLPFVVVADGQRCYLGAFWGFGSSYMPKVPFIGGFRPGWRENKIQISPAEPIAGTTDPRNDPRVRKILEELGIAKRAKVPKAGTNAPVWGRAVDGLRCRWFGAVKEVRAGAAAMVGMEIENVSGQEIFWQCREGTWLIRHPRAAPGTPVGTSPRFEVSLGEGVREATTEEAQRHHEGSGSAIGYYVLEPGAKMIITAAYPYPLVESGSVEVEGFLHRENPGGGGGYFVGQVLRNVMTCPPLVLEIVGGVKKPVIEGLSVSVACAGPSVKTANELELVVSIENRSGGEVELDHWGLEDDFPVVTLDMVSQESGPHILCTKEACWSGTGLVPKALKNNENKSKSIRVRECWRWEGGRPVLSPGRYRVKAKVRSLAAAGQLVETESQPIWVTILEWPWGEALRGVQVRLRTDKAMFGAGEPVTLKADVYNGGKKEVRGRYNKYGICRLQLDNQFYAWGGGPVLGPPIKPGGQVEGIAVPLDNTWVGENKLNLSPGKHVIRVYFVPQGKDDRGLSALVLSNPVEITIIADEGAGESGSARAIGVSPATIGVYRQLDEIVDLSGWKPEMSFGDAIEELKNSVEPPLKIVVLWGDLAENADIDQSTQINLGPLPPVRLSFALELLLKSVSSGLAMAEVGYAVKDGVITIATVDSLPNKLETRVYDIALLVGPPLPGGYGATFYGKYRPNAEAIEKSNERAKEIAKLIEELIEPDSWFGTGGQGVIRLYDNRKLIVLQTSEVHQKIEKLLRNMQRPGLGEAGITYPKEFPYPVPRWQGVRAGEPNSAVQIEGRFILLSSECEIGDLSAALEDSLAKPIMVEPNVTHHLLEDEQMVRLLTLIKDDPNCGKTLAAPKVTVLSGESATLSIQTQTVVALPPQVTGEALPEMLRPGTDRTIPSGITLNVTPIITPDKENILLNLNIQMNNFLGMKTYTFEVPTPDGGVAKYERELPQIETISVQTRVSIPNGATLLLAGQKVKSKCEQDGQIVEKDLLILVKAEIVKVSYIDGKACPSGGGYLVAPPVKSAEPNSPDVNSARRR